MSNREIFLTAHSIARETRTKFDTYRAAFSRALRQIYASLRAGITLGAPSVAEKLEALGLSAWERGGMVRYYINTADLEKVFNCSIDRYKTGNICSAMLNGEPISNTKAGKLFNGRKIFFDAVSKTWRQSYLFETTDLCDELKAALRV